MNVFTHNSNHNILLTALTKRREETVERCLRAAERTSRPLVFSHSTALLLLGAELPDRIARRARAELHVCSASQADRPQSAAFIPHLWTAGMDERHPFSGLTCVGPAVAWAQLAETLTLEELVVLGDGLMRRDPVLRLAETSDFEALLEGTARFRAKDACKLAMRFMRSDTDSSRETLTRLLIERHGLPCPQVNCKVIAENGRIMFLDMAYRALRIAIEYQGTHHDTDLHQARMDRAKRDFLRARGWLWLEPDNRIFLNDDQAAEFIDNLALLLTQRLGCPIIATPPMTLRQAADGRRTHNRRNARLSL